jgi:hypothetical protein
VEAFVGRAMVRGNAIELQGVDAVWQDADAAIAYACGGRVRLPPLSIRRRKGDRRFRVWLSAHGELAKLQRAVGGFVATIKFYRRLHASLPLSSFLWPR